MNTRSIVLACALTACSKSESGAHDAVTIEDVNTIGLDGNAGFDGGFAPAWKANAPLGAFIAIPGTEGAGGAAIDAYSGFTLREDTAELFILAAGGHSDSSDNRVVSLDLREDAPTWVMRSEPSPSPIVNAAYYSDGKPGSTHLYDYTAWVPQAGGTGRFMRFGMFGRYSDGGGRQTVDGFDPLTNTWDPAGTYPSLPGQADSASNYGTTRDKATGTIYSTGTTVKWSAGSNEWTPTTSFDLGRFPIAYDTKRSAFFSLQWGDGQGYDVNLGVRARQATPSSGSTRTISFTPSAAYAQFQADQPQYAAMDYDQVNDVFLFFAGRSAVDGEVPTRIYVVTPNDSTTWTMDVLAIAGGGDIPEPPVGSGIQGRFKYVPGLGGFVYLPRRTARLYFLRTT